MLKGNNCVSINILSQPIATVTSSVKIVYLTDCVNFYLKDDQDWLPCGFKTHEITFRTDLMILNPNVVIIAHFKTIFVLFIYFQLKL